MSSRTVYISSTFSDFIKEREQIERWLTKANFTPRHSYIASGEPVVTHCLDDVYESDIYILLLGARYGDQPIVDNPNNLSITHLEFRAARDKGLDCLVFERTTVPDMKFIDFDEKKKKLDDFKREIGNFVTPDKYTGAGDIINVVSAAMTRLSKKKRSGLVELELPLGLEDPSDLAEDQGLRGRLREERQPYMSFNEPQGNISGLSPDVDKLTEAVKNNPKPLVITGEGGVGKTRLAIEIVNRMRNAFIPALINKEATENGLNKAFSIASQESKKLLLVLDYIEDMGNLSFDSLVSWVALRKKGVRLVVTTRRSEKTEGNNTGPRKLTPGFCMFIDLGNPRFKSWRRETSKAILELSSSIKSHETVPDCLNEIDNPAIATLLAYDAEQHGVVDLMQASFDADWLLRRLRKRLDTSLNRTEFVMLLGLFPHDQDLHSVLCQNLHYQKVLNGLEAQGWVSRGAVSKPNWRLGHDLLADIPICSEILKEANPGLRVDIIKRMHELLPDNKVAKTTFSRSLARALYRLIGDCYNVETFSILYHIGPILAEGNSYPEKAKEVAGEALASLSLTLNERVRIYEELPSLTRYQLDALGDVFSDEVSKLGSLSRHEGGALEQLIVESSLGDIEWVRYIEKKYGGINCNLYSGSGDLSWINKMDPGYARSIEGVSEKIHEAVESHLQEQRLVFARYLKSLIKINAVRDFEAGTLMDLRDGVVEKSVTDKSKGFGDVKVMTVPRTNKDAVGWRDRFHNSVDLEGRELFLKVEEVTWMLLDNGLGREVYPFMEMLVRKQGGKNTNDALAIDVGMKTLLALALDWEDMVRILEVLPNLSARKLKDLEIVYSEEADHLLSLASEFPEDVLKLIKRKSRGNDYWRDCLINKYKMEGNIDLIDWDFSTLLSTRKEHTNMRSPLLDSEIQESLLSLGEDSHEEVQVTVAEALLIRAKELNQLDRNPDAYLPLIEKFSDSPHPRIQETVAKGMIMRARSMAKGDANPDCYSPLIEKFGDSSYPQVQELVAKGMFMRARGIAERDADPDCFLPLIEKFGDSSYPQVQELVAKGMFMRARGIAERDADPDCFLPLIEKFGDSFHPQVQELVAKGMFMRARGIAEQDADPDCFLPLIEKFSDSSHPQVQELVAKGMFMRAQGIDERDADPDCYSPPIEKFGDSSHPQVQKLVATGMYNQAQGIAERDANPDSFLPVIEKFHSSPNTDIQNIVLSARSARVGWLVVYGSNQVALVEGGPILESEHNSLIERVVIMFLLWLASLDPVRRSELDLMITEIPDGERSSWTFDEFTDVINNLDSGDKAYAQRFIEKFEKHDKS